MNRFRLQEIRNRIVCSNCGKSSWVWNDWPQYPGHEGFLPVQFSEVGKCFFCRKEYKITVFVEDLDGAE